jgi:hypothetical protein
VLLGPNATSFSWPGLAPGEYKCFHVNAFGAAGDSPWTGWACTSTPGA